MAEMIKSPLKPGTYMALLRRSFCFPLAVYSERVTGITVGRFFSVAYYCPYQWNRRITNECSRAIGYVKEVDGQSEVHFIRTAGMLSPFWLIFWTVVISAFYYLKLDEISFFSVAICAAVAFAVCVVTAFIDSLTEEGIQGAGVITNLLEKPDEFYC